MWSPWSEANPAEVGLAALVLAFHVVAAPILLNSGAALGTLLRVRRQPVARLAVVLALLQPFLDQDAVHLLGKTCINKFQPRYADADRFMPVFSTAKAERVSTVACHQVRLRLC